MKKHLFLFATALAFVMASAAQTKPAPKSDGKPSALDKTTLENYVRHLQAWDRTVTVEISDPKPSPVDGFLQFDIHASKANASSDVAIFVSKDGKHILDGTFYATADNPYKPELDKLKPLTSSAPNYGTAGAPVVIVEFSDFECPYCREEAKLLRANLLNAYPKEVHLYHLDMPLERLHPWARTAAIAGHCVSKQNSGAFWNYYDWIYEHQADITPDNLKAKVLEWAQGKGDLDSLQLNRCIDNRETDPDVEKSLEAAKSLHIIQTPMFFINGRRMAGAIDLGTLKMVIDNEIEYQKTAKNAGEDCGCAVTLPSLGGAPTPTLGGPK